ncbi:MAG: TonB-dependent receptor [Acidobacteriia bacterium]|nr:TonB-dependent receptor [Terriglobia bacterium]
MTLKAQLGAALMALLCLAKIYGQAAGGQIQVEIKDPSGGAVQASGNLENIQTGARRAFQTDSGGSYTFSDLTVGRYRLEIEKPGFAKQSVVVDVRSTGPVSRTVTLALETQATRIDVATPTPIPGTDLPLDAIPSPVQTADARDLEQNGALDLADFMNKRLNGVFINQNQENPFQPDVSYRGYTASPLLGTPEGISVYMDGVRQNQPFGDVVAWDLIPKNAISEVALMPGSNPLFGLNTLGGALSVQMKDGYSAPGWALTVSGGSFGRRQGEIEYGGSSSRGLSWYVAGNLFREDGWRQLSPSEVRQTFGKLGWRHGKTSIWLSGGYADNWLTGNGLQDFRFLAQHYSSVYTIPDVTLDHSPFVTLNLRHDVTPNLTFSGVGYFRYIRSDTANADLNSNSFDESLYNLSSADAAALTAAGYTGFPVTGTAATEPFPYWRCIAQGLENTEPVEKCDGTFTRTWTKQNNYGVSGQAAWHASRNHLTVGAALDHSSMTFQQSVQFAYLNPDRITFTPLPFFSNGQSTSNGVPVDQRVYLHGTVNTPSIYFTDTYSISKWNFTVSGRYNRSTVDNVDRLPPGFASTPGSEGGRASLNGNYVFGRFNPAAGLTFAASRLFSAYASYSESSRAPSATELGCSNPNDPCNLPNALVSDPPLKQVVARTVEAGVRNGGESNLRWNLGWFWTQNYNDLLFVASEQTGFGYFTNFGKTRRDGVEASVSGKIGHFTLGGNYTFLNATYQSPQSIDGGSNSSNASAAQGFFGVDDNLNIVPGDRIPQIPRNLLKAFADFDISRFSADLDFFAVGRSYARGNENNLDQPDGVYYLGQGYSPGYGVLNAGAHYQLQRRVQIFVQVDNLLNHRYYTAAQLGPTPFDNNGNFIGRPFAPIRGGGDGNYPIRTTTFFAPGAPIGAWGGLRFRF